MLKIEKINFAIEGRPLFEEASATIPSGHKVGLVGANGAGKTTLFKLIRGELTLDGGDISIPARSRIGGVAQEAAASDQSLLDTVLDADQERITLLAEAEAAPDPMRLGEIYARLNDIDAWTAEARASNILRGLGFGAAEQAQPTSAFSGGWRMRVALAAVLFAEPEILLLDEPTNYLDLEGAIWLEKYLAGYPHTVVIISHDRQLLNRAVNAILHLSEKKLTYYSGPYDQFARQRAERAALASAAAKKQEARKAELQAFVDRFKAKASKAKQAQSRVKMIEKMNPINTPEEAREFAFTFPEPEELSPPIINLDRVDVGYDGVPVLRNLSLRIDQDDRIALLGRNGQGKSTLSKLLAEKLPTLAGDMSKSRKLRVGYFAQHQVDELHLDETPLQHLITERPTEHHSKLRARLAGFGLGPDQATTEVRKLSGGQKARLSLLLATLDAPHMLILDEPTNHLDIESREALVTALTQYSGAVILVSHDLHLLSLVADRLWLVNNGGVSVYEDDLNAYRKLLLSEAGQAAKTATAPVEAPKSEAKPDTPEPAPKASQKLTPAKAQAAVEAAEERMAKLEDMKREIEERLGDPSIYEPANIAMLNKWQDNLAKVEAAIAKVERDWEKAAAAALET